AVRSLSPEESALWARVTATIRPLSRDKADAPQIDSVPAPASLKGRIPVPRPAPLTPKRIENIRDATLDGGWDRRIRTGRIEPDRVLDLHAHSLDLAGAAFARARESDTH